MSGIVLDELPLLSHRSSGNLGKAPGQNPGGFSFAMKVDTVEVFDTETEHFFCRNRIFFRLGVGPKTDSNFSEKFFSRQSKKPETFEFLNKVGEPVFLSCVEMKDLKRSDSS